MGLDSLALLHIAGSPPDVETMHLPDGRLHGTESLNDAYAGICVGPGQRHERLHRGLCRQPTLAHCVLHLLGKYAHQRESTAHPARGSVEPSRQIPGFLTMLIAKLPEQPRFFQRRPLSASIKPVTHYQRFDSR